MRDSEDVDEASNWCDRWCERCALIARCPIGRLAGRRSDQPMDASVMTMLERANALLELEMAKAGVEVGPAEEAEFLAEQEALRAHPLHRQARAWTELASGWLPGKSGEAAEVVGWYRSLVPAKVHRALGSQAERDFDALGTAKVVTLALHSVIEAVTDWCSTHPLDRSGMELVVASTDLIASVEATFPGHLAFRRPGLDP